MSSIDSKIKALLLQKKKIEYVSYIADLMKNDTKCIDFLDVKEDILAKVEPFLLGLMTAIENNTADNVPVLKEGVVIPGLTPEQAQALVQIADKVLTKQAEVPKAEKSLQVSRPLVSNADKMNFAMSNRHLANKRVQVLNDMNVTITGLVCGLDAPNIVDKTDTGPVINVPLEKIVVQ